MRRAGLIRNFLFWAILLGFATKTLLAGLGLESQGIFSWSMFAVPASICEVQATEVGDASVNTSVNAEEGRIERMDWYKVLGISYPPAAEFEERNIFGIKDLNHLARRICAHRQRPFRLEMQCGVGGNKLSPVRLETDCASLPTAESEYGRGLRD